MNDSALLTRAEADPLGARLLRALRRQGLEGAALGAALSAAGLYDDAWREDELNRWQQELAQVRRGQSSLPLDWRLRLASGPPGALLLCTGGMSPAHRGHLGLMNEAQQALEQAGVPVIGGLMAPDHDGYVFGKYQGQAALSAPWRLQLLGAALEDPTVNANATFAAWSWPALGAPRDLNFTVLSERLWAEIDGAGLPVTTLYLVCGSDNAAFGVLYDLAQDPQSPAWTGRCGLVTVSRDPAAGSQQTGSQQTTAGTPTVIWTQGQATGVSSSALRRGPLETQRAQAERDLTPDQRELTGRWALDWRALDPEARGEQSEPGSGERDPEVLHWYALRDDLEASAPRDPAWSESEWERRREQFAQDVTRAIGDAARWSRWPGRDARLRIERVDVREQLALAETCAREARLCGHGVLSLDPLLQAWPESGPYPAWPGAQLGQAQHLGRSRLFQAGGHQRRGRQLVRRPESQGEPALSTEPTHVIDDDVASGETLRRLGEEGWEISAHTSLLREWQRRRGLPDPLDVCDLRDFLIGARWGGLVVGPSSAPGRAPYLAPWVNLATRASMPPSSLARVQGALLEANLRYWQGSELRLRDLDEPLRRTLTRLGADLDQTVSAFAQFLDARHSGAVTAQTQEPQEAS